MALALYFFKAIRWTAIPLAIAGLLTLLSGFTTTKYFMVPVLGYNLSYFIHTIIFPLVFLPLFFIHSLAGTFIMMGRHPRINRKPLKIGVVLLWFAVLGIFLFLYVAQAPSPGLSTGDNSTLPGGNSSGTTLSLAEIAKHNSEADCWIIINGKVYDVTSYLQSHPGGADQITPYCGENATAAYDTKGGRGNPHSSLADSSLGTILLGNVGDSVSGQPQNPGTPVPGTGNATQSPPPVAGNVTLSLAEIARHNSQADCWIIINNNVYDVTNHLRAHPAGAGTITPYCGQDATTAYDTKGGRGSPHSSFADSTLGPILLGSVGSTVSDQTVQAAQNQTIPNLGDDDEEWDGD